MIDISIKKEEIDKLLLQIESDRREISMKEQTIKKIKAQKLENSDDDIKISKKKIKDIKIVDDNEDFEDEVSYYFQDIEKLEDNDDLENALIKILPKKNNKNYKKLLFRFKMELLKNIKDLRDLILMDDSFTDEDIREINEDIELYFKKIYVIDSVKDEKEIINNDEIRDNDLIFLKKDDDSIKLIDDIKKIDVVYYDKILELLNSIKDGTLKNPKNFSNNNNFTGISEVRLPKVRVIYDRIGYDKYAIITTFVKKTDNSKGYREFISHRIKNYMEQKKLLKEQINDEEFIKENKNIEEEIYGILNNNEKEGEKVYEKQL